MLKPVTGHPKKFIDSITGQIIEVREYRAFEYTFRFIGFSTQQVKPLDEEWILKSWSVLLHPWPEVIPTSILVELLINGITEVKAPLFSVAEPLARPEDQELRDRIEAVEKYLKMKEPIRPVKQLNRAVGRRYHIHARITEGEPVDLSPFLGLDTFELHLGGFKR